MSGFSIKAAGFWFSIIDICIASATLILSCIHGTQMNLLQISLTALIVNIVWAVVQVSPSCRWSELKSSTAGDHNFLPRWAVSILFGFFYCNDAFRVAQYAADSYESAAVINFPFLKLIFYVFMSFRLHLDLKLSFAFWLQLLTLYKQCFA